MILLKSVLSLNSTEGPLKWARRAAGEVGLLSDKVVKMMNGSQVSWESVENRTEQVCEIAPQNS